jgi:hypothetical protein
MVNRILLAAILCAGATASGLPFAVAAADEAATAPSLELVDQPASDEELKKESGSAVQSVGGNSAGGMLLPSSGQAVGTAPSFDNGGNSTVSTSSSLTSVSTLSATIDSNGFQN